MIIIGGTASGTCIGGTKIGMEAARACANISGGEHSAGYSSPAHTIAARDVSGQQSFAK